MALAIVLEKTRELALRDIDIDLTLGDCDVRIAMDVVGICGNDVHYYRHGSIGPFIVKKPMILGHEGAGTVIACGANVHNLTVGDRVCVEPGVPDFASRPSRIGLYNLDPSLTFWATPPVHGCLTSVALHGSFPFPKRQMAILGPIIEALVRPMVKAGCHFCLCCTVAAELIGDDPLGRKAIALH